MTNAAPLLLLLALSLPVGAVAQSPQEASVELDLAYVADGGHKQQLDLYTPSTAGFPTILFVHGGSLTSGDRKDEPTAQMCETFQSLGIACAAMSYQLAPEHHWPTMPRDVASAFAWVKRNITARGGDPDRVLLFGHSSGCLLSAIVSADETYLAAHGLGPRDVAGTIPMGCRLNDRLEVADSPNEFTRDYEVMRISSSRVEGFLSENPYETVEDVNNAVPAAHVTEDLPPTLVLVAEGERFFPPILRDGAEFVGRALAAGAEAELIVLENRRHMSAIEMMVTAEDPTLRLVVDFVESH